MPKYTPKYTQEALDNALAEISRGLSFRKASAKYRIAKTTLVDRMTGNYDVIMTSANLTNTSRTNLAKISVYFLS